MATRASSKKDPSQKSKPTADNPADRAARPQPPTDLISPSRKKLPTETRTSPRSAVPPILKPKAPEATPVPAPAVTPPKPETVSLIDDSRPKRSDSSSAEPKPKSVLPPISKIRPPTLAKAPEPAIQLVQPAQPVQTETAPVNASEPTPPILDDKIIHIKPPIIVRDLAQQIGLKPFQLIHDLMDMNIFAAINHTIEPDVAAAICKKHGYTFEVEKREKGAGVHTRPLGVQEPPRPAIPTKEKLKTRDPITPCQRHSDHRTP